MNLKGKKSAWSLGSDQPLTDPNEDVFGYADVSPAAWEKALVEFEGEDRVKGVWASVYADAQGNEALAKSKYLARRSMEIHRDALAG